MEVGEKEVNAALGDAMVSNGSLKMIPADGVQEGQAYVPTWKQGGDRVSESGAPDARILLEARLLFEDWQETGSFRSLARALVLDTRAVQLPMELIQRLALKIMYLPEVLSSTRDAILITGWVELITPAMHGQGYALEGIEVFEDLAQQWQAQVPYALDANLTAENADSEYEEFSSFLQMLAGLLLSVGRRSRAVEIVMQSLNVLDLCSPGFKTRADEMRLSVFAAMSSIMEIHSDISKKKLEEARVILEKAFSIKSHPDDRNFGPMLWKRCLVYQKLGSVDGVGTLADLQQWMALARVADERMHELYGAEGMLTCMEKVVFLGELQKAPPKPRLEIEASFLPSGNIKKKTTKKKTKSKKKK